MAGRLEYAPLDMMAVIPAGVISKNSKSLAALNTIGGAIGLKAGNSNSWVAEKAFNEFFNSISITSLMPEENWSSWLSLFVLMIRFSEKTKSLLFLRLDRYLEKDPWLAAKSSLYDSSSERVPFIMSLTWLDCTAEEKMALFLKAELAENKCALKSASSFSELEPALVVPRCDIYGTKLIFFGPPVGQIWLSLEPVVP